MFVVIFFLILNFAQAGQSVVRGEYILTAKSALTIKELNSLLNDSPAILSLGKNRYLLKFKHDPGLKTLEKKLEHKDFKIQPNFKYRTFSLPENQLQNKFQR